MCLNRSLKIWSKVASKFRLPSNYFNKVCLLHADEDCEENIFYNYDFVTLIWIIKTTCRAMVLDVAITFHCQCLCSWQFACFSLTSQSDVLVNEKCFQLLIACQFLPVSWRPTCPQECRIYCLGVVLDFQKLQFALEILQVLWLPHTCWGQEEAVGAQHPFNPALPFAPLSKRESACCPCTDFITV